MSILSPNYFNTTDEIGKTLKKYKIKAERQDGVVLRFFALNPSRLFTPPEVRSFAFANYKPAPLLTSVRRAMSVLTKKGFLRKTSVKEEGEYGRDNYTWTLR